MHCRACTASCYQMEVTASVAGAATVIAVATPTAVAVPAVVAMMTRSSPSRMALVMALALELAQQPGS